ncbi:hypothetical protein G6F70_004483 [Rhizopus microsporus]|nr:hypothetical protein G6F71_002961 [Rhizopus microsporus]KAG1199916.1 hypothetical protein G6F70_004483 [Rhizopus microsporus]KAG1210685.1 hypothetical protein G6F69_005247 [Rhizopus microsporus]KAG1232426.1 hypothetical protein G6F67_005014 [Rhizopus microsporus]KAG1264638.1 hypothetical protein G6F68_004202 [Rhizopus microsporus]
MIFRFGSLQHHGLLNHKARTSNAIESYHSALYTLLKQLIEEQLSVEDVPDFKTDLLREFVAEDTLKESIEKHFKNPCNERKQKQKDYSELLEELLEEIRDLLIKDTDHEADEAKKTSEQHAANIHQYNKTLRPNTANFCYIDSIFELLWHSAIPHFEEVILSKFDSHNKFDSILKTSYKWHRLNTDDGRNCVSYSLRKFVWENKISNRGKVSAELPDSTTRHNLIETGKLPRFLFVSNLTNITPTALKKTPQKFPYVVEIAETKYVLHGKVYSTEPSGVHFYAVSKISFNGTTFLKIFDNSSGNNLQVLNTNENNFRNYLESPVNAVIACYRKNN